MPKHTFKNYENVLDKKEMAAILTDVLIMESFVTEKVGNLNIDSMAMLKKSMYAPILYHHKTDSASFYSTFEYYQENPREFIDLLSLVDSNLAKIKPLDTTVIKEKPIVNTPKDIDILPNFNDQEKAMQQEYLKEKQNLQNLKRIKERNKK